jgi:DNA-binding Xre family transcriptional regulator
MSTKLHIKRRGGMAWKVSVSPVKERALANGINNINQLASCAGIHWQTAKRWWNDDPEMLYLDKPTLIALALCLECKPGDLITMVEELIEE